MKKFLLTMFILIFASVLFANGTSEADLLFFPTNAVNNQKVMINLANTSHATTTPFKFDFQNGIEGNLAIFRLRDTLYNGTTNPTTPATGSTGVKLHDVRIESLDNWCFVNENNPTQVRPFTLDIFCVESRFSWNDRNYQTANAIKVNVNSNTTLPKSNLTKTYVTKDASAYTVKVPDSDFSNNLGNFRAWNVRDFDVCIGLDGDYSGLEPGYYETRLRVTASYKKHTSKNDAGTNQNIDVEIRIRGYIGVDYEEVTDGMTYSFSVLSAADTYNINLGLLDDSGMSQDSYYDVASINFMNVYTGSAQYGKNGTSNDTESHAKSRFEIYISPTPSYNVGGKYQFRKLGTENQVSSFKNTVYYDLYVKNAAGTGYLPLTSSRAATAIQGKVSTETNANGGGINVVSGTNNSVYKFRPYFESKLVSSVGGNRYVVQWNAELELYIKVANESRTVEGDASLTHNHGMYYSYIYVTLVTT